MYRPVIGDNDYALTVPGAAGWAGWLRAGLRLLSADLIGIFDALAALQDRARQRHALAALDERMLRDIGIDRAQVWIETEKPFWRE